MSAQAKVTKSGNHPAVIAHRRKMDSISVTTLPVLEALNARLDRALERAQADDDEDDDHSSSRGRDRESGPLEDDEMPHVAATPSTRDP